MADLPAMQPRPLQIAIAGAIVASAGGAHADGWLVAEAPAAIAISDAQASAFRFGAMPAVGVYAETGWLALGLRMRVGMLRNGPAQGSGFDDPGTGGLTTAGFAARASKWGGWVEVV